MGSFYASVTVIGATVEAVTAVCPRPAYVAADGDVVVVFGQAIDGYDDPDGALSAELGCTTLTVGVFDSDVLHYTVHRDGRLLTEGAEPDMAAYVGIDPDELKAMGPEAAAELGLGIVRPADPQALVAAVGRGDVGAVTEAFGGRFVYADEMHEAVLAALGLPTFAARWGYRYLQGDTGEYTGPPLVHLD